MKYFLVVAFFFFYLNISAQINSGKITYKLNMDEFYKGLEEQQSSQSVLNMFEKTIGLIEDMSFTLEFDHEKGLFKKEKTMAVGNEITSIVNLANTLATDGIYYYDLKNKKQLFLPTNTPESYYVAQDITPMNWNLTKETKRIGKFNCYKATTHIHKNDKDFLVTAWYTPEIPFSYGPKQFAGTLPGTILELQELVGRTYTATEIILNPKQAIKIEWPKQENIKIIDRKEYDKKGEEVKKKLQELQHY
ncbi:GLPGLI family protein [Zhouia sp. PK063]|uniref:GLPGLI family protein n=1 Tax=Zhouia sp. PK063 TaxID=3373602 RepID=UPI0037AEB24F